MSRPLGLYCIVRHAENEKRLINVDLKKCFSCFYIVPASTFHETSSLELDIIPDDVLWQFAACTRVNCRTCVPLNQSNIVR